MRKIINKHIALLLIVCASLPAWSQPNFKDSIEAYHYWGKRGIIQVVYLYMQDYLATNPKDSVLKKGMYAYDEKFIKGIENKSTTDIEKNFKDLSYFLLNNSWSTTEKKMVLPLKKKLDKKQILDSTFFSVFKVHSLAYIKTTTTIINNYNTSIQKFKIKHGVNMQSTLANSNNTHEDLQAIHSPNKTFLSYLWIIAIFVLGFVIGGLLIYHYTKNKVLTILKSEKYEYERILIEVTHNPLFFRFIHFIEILKKRKDEYKSDSENRIQGEQFVNLKQEIVNLKSKNDELLNENIILGQKLEELNLKGTSGYNKKKNPDESSNNLKTLFYSIPEIDGTFKLESAKDFKEQDSFYKLELISNTNGNIYFLSGDFDLRAIENIDYYLNPVCEVQNIGNRAFAKKVEMINYGSIVLKGGSWQINDKIKIKLV
jgi:hypothetical protein